MKVQGFLVVILLWHSSYSLSMDWEQPKVPQVIIESLENKTKVSIKLKNGNQVIQEILPGQKQSLETLIPLEVSATSHTKKNSSLNTLQNPQKTIFFENANESNHFLSLIFSEELQPKEVIYKTIFLFNKKLFGDISPEKHVATHNYQFKKLETLKISLTISKDDLSGLHAKFKRSFSPFSLKELSIYALSSLICKNKIPAKLPQELKTELNWAINKIKKNSN